MSREPIGREGRTSLRRIPRRSAALFAAACVSVLAVSAGGSWSVRTGQAPGLGRLAAERGRMIGTAIDRSFQPEGRADAYMAVLSREFGLITPENDMKHERLRPTRGSYAFERADSIVSYALARRMRVRGHTLVWHLQLAPWLTSGTWSRAEARELLRDHVTSVVSHFRGRVAAWDVVNEALADDGRRRTTFWSSNIGPDYMESAFRLARAADPGAKLFYNDFEIEGLNPKSDSTWVLLRDLRARGVPVDGIGFQAHFAAGELPSGESMQQNFARFAGLGLAIHITELDIRVRTPASAADLAQQARDYALVVDVCLRTPACDAIVLWGFTDRDSWIPAFFPGYGQALIFDENLEPKPAYHALADRLGRESTPPSGGARTLPTRNH